MPLRPPPFVFREDGWFNMTKAAQHFGKQLQHFWSSPETSEYLLAMADAFGKSSKSDELFTAQRGRHGGTWAHPKLAVFFARWLDVKFAVWCDAVIEGILKGAAEVTVTKPAGSAALAVPQSYAAVVPEWRSGR
nr:KilA-N domain-containing protein [Aquabacterium sp.]